MTRPWHCQICGARGRHLSSCTVERFTHEVGRAAVKSALLDRPMTCAQVLALDKLLYGRPLTGTPPWESWRTA